MQGNGGCKGEWGLHGEGRSWSAPGFPLKKGEFGGANPAPQVPDALYSIAMPTRGADGT